MREKVRVVIDKISRAVGDLWHRVTYFFNYHKLSKKFKIGLIGVGAGLVVFVAIAALLPGHKYKDTVAMGEHSFTNVEVAAYEDNIKAYYDNGGVGTMSEDENDTRSNYEIAFDDRFKNIALKQKAEECGITLDNSDNNLSLNYDNYDFTLIQEQNRNWEIKLQQCVLNAYTFSFVEATYDLPQIDQKPQAEASAIYEDATNRLKEIEPLFKDDKSFDEIAQAVESSNEQNKRDLYTGEDMALFAGTSWCATYRECLNRDTSIANNDTIAKPNNIVDANEAFRSKLHNEGDWTGIITGDNGWLAYYRIEEKTGEFDTWNDFYQSMKDQYAYDTVPTLLLGAIKTIASPFLAVINQDSAYASNSVTPYLRVRSDSGTSLTLEAYNKGNVYISTSYPGTIWPGESSIGSIGSAAGPLNCASAGTFTGFSAGDYSWRSWTFNNPQRMIMSGLSWYTFPDGSRTIYNGQDDPYSVWGGKLFGWYGGYGVANGIANFDLGFVLVVEEPQQPQPVEESTPSARSDGRAEYNTDLKDMLHVKEAILSNNGNDTGKVVSSTSAANYKWPKSNGNNYDTARFMVRAYGPYYDTRPTISNLFLQGQSDKYFSMSSQTVKAGWLAEVNNTLIIGDEVIGQANAGNTLMDAINTARDSGSPIVANDIISVNGATTNSLRTAIDNGTYDSRLQGKKYVVLYIGANDLAGQNGSDSSVYDARVSNLVSSIHTKNPAAQIVFITPFSATTKDPASYTTTTTTGSEKSPTDKFLENSLWRQMAYYSRSISRIIDQTNGGDASNDNKPYVNTMLWFTEPAMTVESNYIDSTGHPENNGDPSFCALATSVSYTCTYSITSNIDVTGSAPYKDLQNMASARSTFNNLIINNLKTMYPLVVNENLSSKSGYGRWGFGSVENSTGGIESQESDKQKGNSETVTISNMTTLPGSNDDSWKKSATFANSSTWPAGVYYFKVNNNKSLNSWQALNHWYAPFGGTRAENNEQVIKTFKPEVVSNVTSDYYEEGEALSDTIYIKEHTASSLWPINNNGAQQQVNVCVDVYGPFETPQPSTPSSDYSGTPNRPDSVTNTSSSYIGKFIETKCQGMNPGSENEGSASFVFDGSDEWDSGYYYFYEYISKDKQTSVISTLIEEDFYPAFNPNPGEGGNTEWTFRKFQPFISSNNVPGSEVWVDVKESNGYGNNKGEDVIDRVVARAARTVEEANNGFQPSADKVSYWPKYDDSDNRHVPVLYKFYMCGGYQYPQAENGDNMTNPTDGKVCNENTAIKTIAKYVTPTSCSTNPVIKNSDGTWPAPGANGNALKIYNYAEGDSTYTSSNSCDINFGRTDGPDNNTGNFYQPGYYYFTSEMVNGDQKTYVSANILPGLSTQTQMSNLILGDWKSKFNPLWTNKTPAALNEIEWAYVQFQPVARSYAGATQDPESTNENNWTTRLSYLYTSDTTNQYKGLQLTCNEHQYMPTWTDMKNDTNFWSKIPAKTLTCEKVSDRVYIGATTSADVSYTGTTKTVKDDNVDSNDGKNWPKTNDNQSGQDGANYEVVKFRTKLYGPFASADAMSSGKSNPAGANEAGSTVTIVPGSVTSVSGQPIAQSCLISAKYGPNYNDFPAYDSTNPNNSLNAYYYQTEKTSIDQKGYYKAVFTRSDDDCATDGSGSLGLTDSNGTPYTTLSLSPGLYVSVVEIWKSDMDENNLYTSAADTSKDYFADNGRDSGNTTQQPKDTNTTNSADKRGQIAGGEVRDLMANDFHSKWGDPYETIFVPPDTDMWTLRGNMSNYIVDWGAKYSDQYWTAGWSNWATNYKDIFGNGLKNHSDENSSYQGEKDYFAPDKNPDELVGKIRVDLYGSFGSLRPDTAECPADKRIATWRVDAADTDITGNSTKLENMLPSTGDGWYVYVFSYGGDDRVPALQTKCSDPDEQFYLGEPEAPSLETKIDIKSTSGKAPTVVSDTVKVTGYVEKDSVVKLSLFRRGGATHNALSDTQICSVQFKIPSSIDPVEYSLSNYMDRNGYVFGENTPDDVAADPNRCFTEEAGHYYWYEEFFDPEGEEIQPPRADGPYEWADIEKEPPEVTTMADVSVKVGEPFHDIAYVKIPEGDTRTYNLYMRAYGPTSGAPVCDVVGKSNLLFESGPHEVKETGEYPSGYTSSVTTGYVYWIESLVDPETNETVAEGSCGKALEITRVYDAEAPGDTWEWTTTGVGAPSAGEIVLSAAKILAITSLLGVGAWQLSDKSSWLMRKINR